MKRFKIWILVLGAVLVSNPVCQGQIRGRAGRTPSPPDTITGTVFDASGAPAPGVHVLTVPLLPGRMAITDTNGKYILNWPTRPMAGRGPRGDEYSVVARDEEHNAVASHVVDATTTRLDLHLQPALTIFVKVQDVDGKPIPRAAATLGVYLNSRTNRPGVSFITYPGSTSPVPGLFSDEKGRVQFGGLPQGYFYRLTVTARGYGMEQLPMIQAADTQTTLLELPPVVLKLANLKLAGQVLGADGQPVAGARVGTTGTGQSGTTTQTDGSGHFTLNVCEGPVSVDASLQGAAGSTQTVGGDTNVVIRLENNSAGRGATNLPSGGAGPRGR